MQGAIPTQSRNLSREVGRTTGVYVPYSFRAVACVLLRSTWTDQYRKVLWDRTCGFSSSSEKTRKSNRSQMSLQRQHFRLIYLKILSVGPAGVWTRDLPLGGPALSQLSLPGGGLSIKIEVTFNRRITVTITWCHRNVRRHYARSSWKVQNETENR